MDIEIGNVNTKANGQRNWIIGHFIESSSPFHSQDFEVKWSKLSKGEAKSQVGSNGIAKTLAILAYGKQQINFPATNDVALLANEGDYVFFESGVEHSWEALEDTLLITIRWPSIPGDQ
jgi:hypothetical protein